MAAPMMLHPLRLSLIGDSRYELEVVDDEGKHQLLICTVVEGDVNHVRFSPSPFMRSLTDPRAVTGAVVVFHRACNQQPINEAE
jgi:hypothetical protein